MKYMLRDIESLNFFFKNSDYYWYYAVLKIIFY